MHEALTPPLAAWESFYVIVGSAAAALLGGAAMLPRDAADALFALGDPDRS